MFQPMRKAVLYNYKGFRSYYMGPRLSVAQIKAKLTEHKGGSIDVVKHDSGVADLIINYPQKLNSLSGDMVCQLDDAIDELVSWDQGKGIILSGAVSAENPKRFFCSGGDLSLVKAAVTTEEGFNISLLMNQCTTKIRLAPLLSVALLQGPAIGGGAELATCCDHRLAVKDAYVAFVQAKMGISPGFGGSIPLVRIVGYPRALDLAVTGRKLKVTEGRLMGFYDGTVDDDQATVQARVWMENRLAPLTPASVKYLKTALNQIYYIPDELKDVDSTEIEARCFAPMWHGPRHKEVLSAGMKHRE